MTAWEKLVAASSGITAWERLNSLPSKSIFIDVLGRDISIDHIDMISTISTDVLAGSIVNSVLSMEVQETSLTTKISETVLEGNIYG